MFFQQRKGKIFQKVKTSVKTTNITHFTVQFIRIQVESTKNPTRYKGLRIWGVAGAASTRSVLVGWRSSDSALAHVDIRGYLSGGKDNNLLPSSEAGTEIFLLQEIFYNSHSATCLFSSLWVSHASGNPQERPSSWQSSPPECFPGHAATSFRLAKGVGD